jgi:uncharacterized YigZ family protein
MRTLSGTAAVEIEIKRSRFIAHASRVDSLAATLAFYEATADPDATHNCWAWKLDHQYRFNDDGEPASTAGKPILSAIEGKGLDHVMIVVTRYFGGVKLGVGGLVRAYSGSASRAIDQANIIEIQPTIEVSIRAGFAALGRIHSTLSACGAHKLSEDFDKDGVLIHAEVEQASFENLKSLLRDTTRGSATVVKTGTRSRATGPFSQ